MGVISEWFPRVAAGFRLIRALSAALLAVLLVGHSLPATAVHAQRLDDYVLGPGDAVEVVVLGEPDLTRTVMIRPDGKIALPLLGDVGAAGLTPTQLAERIATGLRSFLRNPQVSVSVRDFRVERVFAYLVGQVTRPGAIEIQKGWTVLEVMAVSGGVTARAALRRASLIRRSSGQAIPLDLERLLVRGDRSDNVIVEPGDIILVPTLQNRVLVLGAVRSPGAYDLDEGARVIHAVAQAGGPTDRARTRDVGVVRAGDTGKPQVANVNLDQAIRGDQTQNILLRHADVVYVPEGRVRWSDVVGWLAGLGLIRSLFGINGP